MVQHANTLQSDKEKLFLSLFFSGISGNIVFPQNAVWMELIKKKMGEMQEESLCHSQLKQYMIIGE